MPANVVGEETDWYQPLPPVRRPVRDRHNMPATSRPPYEAVVIGISRAAARARLAPAYAPRSPTTSRC